MYLSNIINNTTQYQQNNNTISYKIATQTLRIIVYQCRDDGYLQCVRYLYQMELILEQVNERYFWIYDQVIEYLDQLFNYIFEVIIRNIGDSQNPKKLELKTKLSNIRFRIQQVIENYNRTLPQICQQRVQLVKQLITYKKHANFFTKVYKSSQMLKQIKTHISQSHCPCIEQLIPHIHHLHRIINLHLCRTPTEHPLQQLITWIEGVAEGDQNACRLAPYTREHIDKEINKLMVCVRLAEQVGSGKKQQVGLSEGLDMRRD